MTGFFREVERHVVPRWHSFGGAASRGELDPIFEVDRRPTDRTDLHTRRVEWEEFQTLRFATDFVGTAITYDEPEMAKSAAEFIASQRATPLAHRLARTVLHPEEARISEPESEASVDDERAAGRARVRQLKSLLHADPRNAIGWTDLALNYAVLGQLKPAETSMAMALRLSRENRFILRSAARLFVQADEPGRAHGLVAGSRLTQSDPWLLAAELALASVAERSPTFIRRSREMVRSNAFPPWHTSELTSELATLELEAGSDKAARRLFRAAMVDPTENAVAQTEWASRHLSGLYLEDDFLDLPYSFEARARHNSRKGAWIPALTEAWSWFLDQPVSSEAASLGTYVASVCLEDYETCIEFAKRGLLSNPNNPTILNNLVFALASLNRLEEAERYHARWPEYESLGLWDQTAYRATSGLILYRRGHVEEGRRQYREALSVAGRSRDKQLQAMATIYFAREELLLQTTYAESVIGEALEVGKTCDSPEVRLWNQALERRSPCVREALPSATDKSNRSLVHRTNPRRKGRGR